ARAPLGPRLVRRPRAAPRRRSLGGQGLATLSRYPVAMAQSLGGFEKFLRLGEGRRLKRLWEQAVYVGTLEAEYEKLSDEDLRAKTAELRQRFDNGEPLEEMLFEAFATCREGFKRA